MTALALDLPWGVRDEEPVLWTDGPARVWVHVESLRITRSGPWVNCDLDLEPELARRRRVRFAFLAGDGVLAEATIYSRGVDARCAAEIQQALKAVLAP
jgi:hypothetical protein